MKCQREGGLLELSKVSLINASWKVALSSEEPLDGEVPETAGIESSGI